MEDVVYRRLDDLFRHGHRQGLLPAPPELLSEITRGAVERLSNSRLAYKLDWSTADLLRATVDTLLYGAICPERGGGEGEGGGQGLAEAAGAAALGERDE